MAGGDLTASVGTGTTFRLKKIDQFPECIILGGAIECSAFAVLSNQIHRDQSRYMMGKRGPRNPELLLNLPYRDAVGAHLDQISENRQPGRVAEFA